MKRFWNYAAFAAECIAFGILTTAVIAMALALICGIVSLLELDLFYTMFVVAISAMLLFIVGFITIELLSIGIGKDVFCLLPSARRHAKERLDGIRNNQNERSFKDDRKKTFPRKDEAEDAEIVE